MGNGTTPLSEQQINFISYVEQEFWTHGSVPTVEKTSERLNIPVDTIRGYWKSSQMRSVLIQHGVDLSPDKSDGLLTPKQLMLANMLFNGHDKRSIREKLAELEVSSQQYHSWMRQKPFTDYMKARAEALFQASDADFYLSVIDTMKSGDVQAQKFYAELRGIWNPRVSIDVNIELVLTQVLEIIQARVRDPDTLIAIGEDIEKLLDGVGGRSRTPAALPVVGEIIL